VNIKKFYRYNISKINNLTQSVQDNTFQADIDVMSTLRVGDGIILANWNEDSKKGEATFIGVVIGGIDNETQSLPVTWFEQCFELSPNGAGYQFWRKDFFKFADAPAKRYKLQHYFDGLDVFKVEGDGTPAQASSNSGYIYVIQSEYGYKIGKTTSIKNRSQLFGVKLPFDFSFVYTYFSDRFSKLEVDLHQHFKHKRLNGEWFNLSNEDLEELEGFCTKY